MKKIGLKVILTAIVLVLLITVVQTSVFAAGSKETQVVRDSSGNYIVYVRDLMTTSGFSFAISDSAGLDPSDISLNYINSVTDDEGNQVALIEASTVTGKTETNLYIDDTETKIDLENAFDVSEMEKVETTTKRIKAELKTNIEQRNEEIDGVRYKETIGGLEISDDNKENYTYEFVSVKLPAEKYSELQELADELRDKYSEKDMFEKIEFAKKFNKAFNELVDGTTWQPVEDYLIKQPNDAQKDDQYVVLLKRTSQDDEITHDAKFLISYREDEEEKIPGRTETKAIQETAKLPITGDSLILFAVLGLIIISLIIVFIKMKKDNNQGK